MSDIVIIEDDPASQKLIRGVLENAGHEVRAAATAEDGLALVDERIPQLVIMDVQLPGIDGLVATRRLKRAESTGDIPVLVLTAHAMSGDRSRIMESGCDRYLSKPVRYKDLLSVVDTLIESSGGGHDE